MSQEKRKYMQDFFELQPANFPSFTERAIRTAIGIFAFGIFVIVFFNKTLIIGVLCIFASVFWAYKWLKPYYESKDIFDARPKADIMHKWLIEDLNLEVKKKAIALLSLDESKLKPENFIIVPYPIYWATGNLGVKRRKGDDDKYCYSVWGVQIIAITDYYISYYNCVYDWLKNAVSNESTMEYFYDDISFVNKDSEALTHKMIGEGDKTVGAAKTFKIVHNTGASLSIIFDIPSLDSSPLTKTNLDKALQVLRIIIRNRRYGEVLEQPKAEAPKPTENPKDHNDYSKKH